MEALLAAGCDAHGRDSLLRWTPLQYAQCSYCVNYFDNECSSFRSLLAKREEKIRGKMCYDICRDNCAKVALWVLGESVRCVYGEFLYWAAQTNAQGVVRALLESGTSACGTSACGVRSEPPQVAAEAAFCPRGGDHQEAISEATCQAITEGFLEIALQLLDNISDVNFVTRREESVLHVAVATGCTDTTRRLLEKGADTRVRNSYGQEPLHSVFSYRVPREPNDEERAQYVQHFLEMLPPSVRQAHTNACDDYGRTPLHLAVLNDNVKTVETLLAYGADANAAGNGKTTPLHSAVKKGRVKTIKALLDHDADPSRIDMRRREPLSYLYRPKGFVITEQIAKEIATALLDKNADPNCRRKNGQPLINAAISKDHLGVMDLLLQRGASANATDSKGKLPLHFARSSNTVRLLLQSCNDAEHEHSPPVVNARDQEGRTPLHMAASKGDVGAMKELVASGADTNSADNEGRTPLHLAARTNSLDAVKLLVDAGSNTDTRDHHGEGPLNYVYKKGGSFNQEHCESVIALLLEKGSNPNIRNDMGMTPLHHAVHKDHLNVVQRLLKHGAFVNEPDEKWRLPDVTQSDVSRSLGGEGNSRNDEEYPPLYLRAERGYVTVRKARVPCRPEESVRNIGLTPLHLASKAGAWEVIDVLVTSGADTNIADHEGRTSLHFAAQSHSPDAVKLLINGGSNTAALDHTGQGPLNYVYKKGGSLKPEDCDSIVSLLLEKGSPLNLRDEMGMRPLHHAVCNDHLEVVERLLKHEAQVDDTDCYGGLPLHYARSAGVVALLLGGGASRGRAGGQDAPSSPAADVNARDEGGQTPLHLAAADWMDGGRPVEALVAAGSDPNAQDSEGRTPLHVAASEGGIRTMRVLVESGADTNREDNKGRTSLHLAAQTRVPPAVKLLIDAGSNTDARDHNGLGPLNHLYKIEGSINQQLCESVVALLLEKGSPPNLRDGTGMTPLHHAVHNDHLEAVERLLEHEAQVDVADCDGRIPLHYAGSAGVVALLVGEGVSRGRAGGEADVNARDKRGRTPLHLAAERDNERAVEALVAAGADANARDKRGRTPLRLAVERDNEGAVEALLAAGADPNARDSRGRTPLHVAVYENSSEIVRQLLHAGSRQDALDDQELAPLNYLYVRNPKEKYLNVHERAQEEVSTEDSTEDYRNEELKNNNYTQEEFDEDDSTEEEDEEYLKDEGEEDFKERNNGGKEDSYAYISHKTVEVYEEIFYEDSARVLIAALLLHRGADPNSRDANGRSALHHAARTAHARTVRVLLQHRADVDLRDHRGQTARDLAEEGPLRWPRKKHTFEKILLLLNGQSGLRDSAQAPSRDTSSLSQT